MDPKLSDQIWKAIERYKKPFRNIYDIYGYKLDLVDQDSSFHKKIASLRKKFRCDDLTYEYDWHEPYNYGYPYEGQDHFVFCSTHFHEMTADEKTAFERCIAEVLVEYELSPVFFNSFAHLILYGDRRIFETKVDYYELDLVSVVTDNIDLIPHFKLTTFEKTFIKKTLRLTFQVPKKGRPPKAFQKTSDWKAYKEYCRLIDLCKNPERKKNEATIKAAFSKASSDMERAESFRSIPTDEDGDEIAKKAANRLRQERHRIKKHIRLKKTKIT